jgi:hypothetical protein
MSSIGTDRLYRPVPNHFRCWRLTGCATAVPILLMLTNAVIRVVATSRRCAPHSPRLTRAHTPMHGGGRVWRRAQAMRARVMPLFAEDPFRVSDFCRRETGRSQR